MTRLQGWIGAAVIGCAVVSTACSADPTAPSSSADYSQTDLVVGTGATVGNGNTVQVNYTGWLYDGAAQGFKGPVFDTSTGRGVFTFTQGAGQVIDGWDRGIIGMQAGGVRELVVPPVLAYGANRNGAIPPNATLLFDIQLVAITQ